MSECWISVVITRLTVSMSRFMSARFCLLSSAYALVTCCLRMSSALALAYQFSANTGLTSSRNSRMSCCLTFILVSGFVR
ncbi:hypothetical protein [Cohnella rhizosphaerae]|uniref:Uncharacterized protein n=1 Tax=Cohnella rhizosphaerae TaxID=1457232 RepID=A0A9X4L135_9BACL|nr:hypothetical protein [Cohnella rhizosphaerae]MDG0814283.1 hypothetical protein [Cohnella rhizosphaerae]